MTIDPVLVGAIVMGIGAGINQWKAKGTDPGWWGVLVFCILVLWTRVT